MTSSHCSVVICTRGRPLLLERCLAALTVLDHPSYEIVVVDNTRGQDAVERIATRAGARYIHEPRLGLSRARVTGALAASGEIVAFTDDDAVAAPDWLDHHAAALADQTLAATTGRILLSSQDSPAAREFEQFGGYDLGPTAVRVDRDTPGWFERTNFGGLGNGANLAFRRSLFASGWGFAEWLGHGSGMMGEEHHALFTLVRDGHAVSYLPDAVVYHDPPASLMALERLKRERTSAAAAYLTMLLVEESGYRSAALRYALQALRGKRRPWRPPVSTSPWLSQGDFLRAAAGGPWRYLRARLRSAQVDNPEHRTNQDGRYEDRR